MVLESPERLGAFLLERYKESRKRYGDVLKNPRDVHDMKFPAFIADSAQRIHEIALHLRDAYPHVPEEDHALMAYLLHLLDERLPVIGSPYNRVLRTPRRFFLEYLAKALGSDRFQRIQERYKHHGIPVSELLENVRDLGVGSHVLKRRFFIR